MEAPLLSIRFEEALQYAVQLHSRQLRKGTEVPYAAHLLGVAALVLEDGGDEDQAIAALLHDAVEDQGGLDTLMAIRQRFGNRVAAIVDGCTDAYEFPKPPWRDRKEAYIARLRNEMPEVRRVSLADKLHNARSILLTLRNHGESTWDRFNGGKQGTLWYYNTLLEVYRQASDSPFVAELELTLREIERLADK
jgi:(p)ppGpp synthase/HD superfamily hydrolase